MRNNKTEVLNSWTHIWDACVKMAIKFDWLLCRKLLCRTTCSKFLLQKNVEENLFLSIVVWSAIGNFFYDFKSQISRICIAGGKHNHHWLFGKNRGKKREFGTFNLTTISIFCHDKSSAIKTKRRQSMGKKKKQSMEMAIPENFATFLLRYSHVVVFKTT